MKHTRTWRRVAALALALTTTVAAAPMAVADQAAPEPQSAVEALVPGGAPAVEAPVTAQADPGVSASAAVTERTDAVWEYFRLLNTTRLDATTSPVIQNPTLRTIATTWGRQQASAGTYALDPGLEPKIPGSWSVGYQAIYVSYAADAATAAADVASRYASRDWTDPALTDLGIAMYEAPYTAGINRYTTYVIGVDYPHSVAQAGEMTLYRFYRPSTGTHFYSTSATERNTVILNAAFRYEGQVAYVLAPSVTTASTRPLNRFYQPGSGTHFYTSTQSEYNRVLGFPQYSLDGVAGKVYTAAGTGRVPMYRFFRPASGTHFYTASASEMASVKTMPGYTYEGVAFYLRKAS
jgi:hypothetical protein